MVRLSTRRTGVSVSEPMMVRKPAKSDHPSSDTVLSSRFGAGRDRVRLTKVEPRVVAEGPSTLHAKPEHSSSGVRHSLSLPACSASQSRGLA